MPACRQAGPVPFRRGPVVGQHRQRLADVGERETEPLAGPDDGAGEGAPRSVTRMDLRIFTEPQEGASYDDLLAVARTAEDLGFDGFFRSDHFLHMSGDGLPGPSRRLDHPRGPGARHARIRLGTLVTSATFRLPGALAVTVAGVDAMSGGRVELGLGAGWFENEHTAYGVPFPDVRERFDRLEEQLALITGMWATPVGSTFDHPGPHYPVTGSPALPKPVQGGGVPIIIGGGGRRRTPELAVRHAADFNAGFLSPEGTARLFARVDEECDRQGVPPPASSTPRPRSCASGRTTPPCVAGPRRSASISTSCATTGSPDHPRRRGTGWVASRRWAPAGSTSRC